MLGHEAESGRELAADFVPIASERSNARAESVVADFLPSGPPPGEPECWTSWVMLGFDVIGSEPDDTP